MKCDVIDLLYLGWWDWEDHWTEGMHVLRLLATLTKNNAGSWEKLNNFQHLCYIAQVVRLCSLYNEPFLSFSGSGSSVCTMTLLCLHSPLCFNSSRYHSICTKHSISSTYVRIIVSAEHLHILKPPIHIIFVGQNPIEILMCIALK